MKKHVILSSPFGETARIAQLVEHDLAKVGVASSSLVSRSKPSSEGFIFFLPGWWNW